MGLNKKKKRKKWEKLKPNQAHEWQPQPLKYRMGKRRKGLKEPAVLTPGP